MFRVNTMSSWKFVETVNEKTNFKIDRETVKFIRSRFGYLSNNGNTLGCAKDSTHLLIPSGMAIHKQAVIVSNYMKETHIGNRYLLVCPVEGFLIGTVIGFGNEIFDYTSSLYYD